MIDLELKELVASLVESGRETDRQIKETTQQMRETDRRMQETDRQLKEIQFETAQQMKETDRKLKELGIHLGGISSSNGKFAEEYFYNSLERKMEFAGIHFDDIDDGFGRSKKMPDGSKLKDQFDIVMTNEKAVALIEIKYKAKDEYIEDLVNRKMKNFRILFPDYDKFDIYLGFGSLSFDDKTLKKAKECGVGLLRQVGESIEYNTDWKVRAY